VDKDNIQKPKQPTSSYKGNIQKWDSYNDIASTLTMPTLEESAAVIVIDESVRRKLVIAYFRVNPKFSRSRNELLC
jgi:hypothetical protein